MLYSRASVSVGDNSIAIMEPINDGLNSIKINDQEVGRHKTNYLVSFNGDDWYYNYTENNKHYLNYNNTIFEVYKEYTVVDIESGNWAFENLKNNQLYYVVNGKEFGPFNEDTVFRLLKSGWLEISPKAGGYNIVRHSL